jgi:hypothetical protein
MISSRDNRSSTSDAPPEATTQTENLEMSSAIHNFPGRLPRRSEAT